jgi:hypothetical protein
VTGVDVTMSIAAVTSSNDRRLTSQYPSLLGVTTATGNLMSDY